MDLLSLEPVTDGVSFQPRHPLTNAPLTDDDGKAITFDIVGMDSDPFRTRQRAIVNKRLNAGKKSKVSAEEIEAEAIETLAACIVGWSANVKYAGKILDFSRQNAKFLLTRLPWLREQIDEAIADRANFLKTSPTN